MSETNPFAWLFADTAEAVDPAEILGEVSPNTVYAEKPPAEADYRAADIQGVCCAHCAKFSATTWRSAESSSAGSVEIPQGVCMQWEAMVDGVMVCDRFADDGPAFDLEGKEIWSEFADVTGPIAYHEVHLTGGAAVQERDGKLIKGILRTGEWDETPTPMGKLKRPLKIVKDGRSDPRAGVIALSEILENFKNRRGVKRVQIPFTDKKNDDHIKDGNLARVNTGFVEDLWIEDRGEYAELMAACDIRDVDVKKGVRQRTLEDVSSGIPFHPDYGAFLEHVCITNTPFIDGLSGWIAASDAPTAVKEAEVVHHVLPKSEEGSGETETTEGEQGSGEAEQETAPETTEGEPKPGDEATSLSFRQVCEGALAALDAQFNVPPSLYTIDDATSDEVTVTHTSSNTTWTVPYTVEDGSVKLAAFEQWTTVEGEGETEQPEETAPPDPPSTTESDPVGSTGDPELDHARQLREMRLAASAQPQSTPNGGSTMTVVSREELERLELSDEQRAVFTKLLDAQEAAERQARTGEVDSRIEELKGLGFSDRPGFLKLYRDVALNDDGGPAVIVFSDDGKEKSSKSAKQILDDAIDALLGSENKVAFSDQHVESGNDHKPPVEDGQKRPVQDRVKDARDFLYPNGRS